MTLPVATKEISNNAMSFTLLMPALAPVYKPSVLPLHPATAHCAACRRFEVQPVAAAGLPQQESALRPDTRSEISRLPTGSDAGRERRFFRLPEWLADLD